MNRANSGVDDERVLESAVSKVKRHVLPLFIVMFMVNYIDRVNISFIRPHLQADLGIGAAAYGLGAGLFFLTYSLLEVPSNVLMQRYGARVWLTRIMATWGVVSILMAFIQNEMQFYIVRILLGAAEAGFFPGVLYYFTQWLPDGARGKAVALFLSGSALSSIVSGPLSGALLQLHGLNLHGWQWLFLIEGAGSTLLSGFVWFWLVSRPGEAKWLSADEKRVLVGCIKEENSSRDAYRSIHVSAFKLLRDPQIVLFCFLYFCIQLTIYAALFWLPGVIRTMGHGLGDFQVGLLNSVPWLISIVAMYIYAALAARWRFQQAWVASALIVAAIGLYFSTTSLPIFAFISICFAAIGFKAASSLFWPIPQGYLDPRISAAVIALINSVGNLGGFVAPATFGFLEQHTGSIKGGLYGLAATSVISGLLVFFARLTPKEAPATLVTNE
ncbi:major facilitator transporter [Caballeronia udeis]|uniref:Major facilitator transporter n=1 Tax=Caballeronia udeis TaxID=1232866 RepID=A0A158JIT2_9BURK|nr:MFS transporter [Caballeronia udeis]SAL68525.1 major facilitator transporter [Caballeronia udeis]